MKHFFLDTNILLDLVQGRQPFVAIASQILQCAEDNKVRLYASSLSFTDVYYFSRKLNSHQVTLGLLVDLESGLTVLPVGPAHIKWGISSDFSDFEDAVQHACAVSEKRITTIVTRDKKGFKKSTLRVLSPAEALAEL